MIQLTHKLYDSLLYFFDVCIIFCLFYVEDVVVFSYLYSCHVLFYQLFFFFPSDVWPTCLGK